MSDVEKKARLTAALRENLRKRKVQAREQDAACPASPSPAPRDGAD